MEAWAEQSIQSRLGMYSCDEIIDIFKEATSEAELFFGGWEGPVIGTVNMDG